MISLIKVISFLLLINIKTCYNKIGDINMKKILLVDGNNLLFRSYYATAYNGNFMKNSKGFPTNGLFGFTNMINKIITEEKPQYILVAFDKGKTFRHKMYKDYKSGRSETPEELKIQFPIAKQLLTEMGIKYYEIDNYEADDIIGTFANYCDKDPEWDGIIVSSDKDLLQLISPQVDIKLLKQKNYIKYNDNNFKKEYGINPINVVDLKALMGDPSDNIPGVKGIGEKTALKLLNKYQTIDNLYQNIDQISGTLKEKLITNKQQALLSYKLATIEKNVPVELTMEETKYTGETDKLNNIYKELEFYSLIKKEKKQQSLPKLEINIINDLNEIKTIKPLAIYLEVLGYNYHSAEVLGMGIYNDEISAFIPLETLEKTQQILPKNIKYTYDAKKLLTALKYHNIEVDNITFDTLLAASLLDYIAKDDIAYLANNCQNSIPFYDSIYGKINHLKKPSADIIAYNTVLKAKFIYDTKNTFEKNLQKDKQLELYNQIEVPLTYVLSDMEYTGVKIDEKVLKEMGKDLKSKIELLEKDIYNNAGEQFNISSPQQLGRILFEKLLLPHGKKNQRGYSTSVDVLKKIIDQHPIINQILEYRMLTKLYNTYIEGLMKTIKNDKIHTIYTQVLTKTGRLSSIEPNLQNIPIRNEYGRLIRKAFVPENDYMIGADYSQIELRVLAHMSDVELLKKAFIDGKDIHSQTASDIFDVSIDVVTSRMRRVAKAVNFGIIYGISGFGLGENIGIGPKEATNFINKYLEEYPGIKEYMSETKKIAHEKGYVRTLFNRKRTIPELNNKNHMIVKAGERIALNTPIQGTAADIIKLAMIEIYQEFKKQKLKSKMLLQVHDELIFDVPKEEKSKVINIITNIMEHVYKLNVPLKVEVSSGKNWYEAK